MSQYVHGYDPRENTRLQDQASTLVDLLHGDTHYPAGSRVLEAGCGVGAQTVTLSRNSLNAQITAVDISEQSLAEARERVEASRKSTRQRPLPQDAYLYPHFWRT